MCKGLAFDWDGVLHSDPHYRATFTKVDLAPLVWAMDSNFAVSVTTCNDTWRITSYLRDHGVNARDDNVMPAGGTTSAPCLWQTHGIVLVTNRKPSALLYVDDRAMRWSYGQPLGLFANEVATLLTGKLGNQCGAVAS
jgi:hypothetical protein